MKRTPSMKFPYPGVLLGLVVWILIILSACNTSPPPPEAYKTSYMLNRDVNFADDSAHNVRCYWIERTFGGTVGGQTVAISCIQGILK